MQCSHSEQRCRGLLFYHWLQTTSLISFVVSFVALFAQQHKNKCNIEDIYLHKSLNQPSLGVLVRRISLRDKNSVANSAVVTLESPRGQTYLDPSEGWIKRAFKTNWCFRNNIIFCSWITFIDFYCALGAPNENSARFMNVLGENVKAKK